MLGFGRQLRVWGYRVHHGFVGVCMCAVGVLLCLDDWKDRRDWLPRR